MLHKCKMTILDKKLYPELQEAYCADPQSGPCPCYHVGDQYLFERYDGADDFWKMGAGTLIKATHGIDGVAGGPGRPHCSELWDAVSRYIYTALQGGSIMRGWMKDERVMIACCSDGTRPVIVKLERLDYCAAYLEGSRSREDDLRIAAALQEIPAVQEIIFREHYAEIYLEHDLPRDGAAGDLFGHCVRRFDQVHPELLLSHQDPHRRGAAVQSALRPERQPRPD